MDTCLIKTRYYSHVSVDTVKEFEEEIEKNTDWKYRPESGLITKKIFKLLRRIPFIYNILKRIKINKNFFVILINTGLANKCFPFFYFKTGKMVYLFDCWESLNLYVIDFIKEYNVKTVFFSAKQSSEYFNENCSSVKSYWLPEGIKFENYNFLPYENKDIDILQFGRKFDVYHNLIVDHCEKNNISYLYEKIKGEIIFSDRNDFLKALARTKISICVPSNITHPERSGNVSTMTQRYLQSMASKCLILGIMPEDMKELFDYEPVIRLNLEDARGQLDDILSNFNKYIPLIEQNYNFVKENHQWKNRIEVLEKVVKEHFIKKSHTFSHSLFC